MTELGDLVQAGVAHGQDLGTGDVSVAALTDVGDLGGDSQAADVILGDFQLSLALVQDLGAVQIGELVSNDHALDLLELEGLVTQSLIDLGVTLAAVCWC